MTNTAESMETIWASDGGGTPKQGGGSKGDQKGIEPITQEAPQEGGGTPDQGGGSKGDKKDVPPVRRDR